MKRKRDVLWTWLLPDAPRVMAPADERQWMRHGGKWIVFDRKERLLALARKLAPYIDSGEIPSAKYWNKDPGAICVYSLDAERERVKGILDALGAARSRVWEYDYAWDKNVKDPVNFVYSQFSKFSTILRSYGLFGAIRLAAEILKPQK